MDPDESAQNGQWIRSAVARFERPLTLYAARIVGDAERARDVVQEAFAQLCRLRDGGDVSLPEWLYTVCRNRALDVRRKERRMTQLDEAQADAFASGSPDPAEQAQHADDATSVLALLDALPPNQQEAIRLKFQHGLSYKQIAAVMNQSTSNVGFLIHTGLKTIRRQMNPEK